MSSLQQRLGLCCLLLTKETNGERKGCGEGGGVGILNHTAEWEVLLQRFTLLCASLSSFFPANFGNNSVRWAEKMETYFLGSMAGLRVLLPGALNYCTFIYLII